jgi:predicted flap endonuclease-1-like 5' DNA nuclease
VRHVDDPLGPNGRAEPPRSTEEALTTALEALAARDRLLAERFRRLMALEDTADHLAAATARLDAVSSDLAALRLARQSELAQRDRRIAELEAALVEARPAAETVREATDDLQRIKGIGPVIEALLHSVGVTTFRQIATFNQEELRRVGDLLGVFRGRIERDGWIRQAAQLTGGRAARATDQRPP